MVQTLEQIKSYRKQYYIKNKAAYQKRYQDWCENHPGENRSVRSSKKTPEESKKYRQDYYLTHKAKYREIHRRWCAENPKRFADGQQNWRDRNRHYPRDYKRERVAVVDPLIFQFLDGGFDSEITDFVDYLRSKGIPEKHIGWFQSDIQKLEGVK